MADKRIITAPRQQEVFDFIRSTIHRRGYAPSVREIADKFEMSSPNGVMGHLRALETKGYIARSPNRSRAIELLEDGQVDDHSLPLAGTVAAGLTNLAFEQNESINFSQLFANADNFVLRVNGDSMIEAQISDGDYVVIRKQKNAKAGDMVVAATEEGEATLKYWFPERNRIRLQPANATMQPIYLKNATVVGVVVGVVRNMN